MGDEFVIVTFANQIFQLNLKYIIVNHMQSIIFKDQIIIPYLKQY